MDRESVGIASDYPEQSLQVQTRPAGFTLSHPAPIEIPLPSIFVHHFQPLPAYSHSPPKLAHPGIEPVSVPPAIMESNTYTFECPHCGQRMSGKPGDAGASAPCPACGKSFTIPAPLRPAGAARNPLLLPLLGISAILLVALGAAGVLFLRRDAAPPPASQPARDSLPASNPASGAQPNSFEEVTAHLDRGGPLYLYLGTEQWMAGLSRQIAFFRDLALPTLPAQQNPAEREQILRAFDLVTDLVKKSGLEEITGLGASSIATGQGLYRSKLFVHHYSGKGDGFLWSAFGKKPHRLDALDFLPANTAFANFTDVDIAQLFRVLRQEIDHSGIPEARKALDQALAQFSSAAGMPLDDLLKSLDGSMGMIVTLDPAKSISVPLEGRTASIPAPRLAIFLRVKDDRIFKQFDHAMGANPDILRVDESDLRMRTAPMPALAPMDLRPTVAQWTNDYFILASNEKIVRDMIDAQKTGKGLKSTPQFASLAEGLPEEGNAFQIVTKQFGETFRDLQREMMKNQPGATPEQTAMMEKLFSYQKPGTSYSISTHLENGWLVAGKGTTGAAQMFGPLLIAPAAIAAGIALPVFTSVAEKGNLTKSLSQEKQIALACKLYAADHNGNFPPTLQALIPDYLTDTKLFVSPFAPIVPMGYAYTSGLTDTSPPKTVLIKDKFSSQARHLIVAHVDGSAEATRIPTVPVP
jgi:hypothetical protein